MSSLALSDDSLEVELIVETIVRVPPFLTVDRESNANHELTLVELSLEVFELDAEAESIPSFIMRCRRWNVADVTARHLGHGPDH